MATATISAPMGTQTGNFNIMVAFDTTITGLAKTDFTLRALTENGVTGIDWTISGTEPNANFNLAFTLPNNVEGSFEISLTGQVTPAGQSSPETVTANALTVLYDNTVNVTAAFGTVVYREDGVLAVPVTFTENVIAPAKSICAVTHVSGDDLSGVAYRFVGKNKNYELVFVLPHDRIGSFRVDITGDVFKVATRVWDNVVITPITVSYDTRVPRIVDYDIPANYVVGQTFYVRVAFNVKVTGWHLNNTFTEIFIEEGARLGTPTPYKWVGTSPPDIHAELPDPLPTEWTLLPAPPGGHSGQWHGEEGQYFLIAFTSVDKNATGIFEMTLRDGGVRGPVSS